MTLKEHARKLLDEGYGNDGAIMEFIKAMWEVIDEKDREGTGELPGSGLHGPSL